MGGYDGHVVPGLVISFWGLCWLVLTFLAHLKTERRRRGSGAARNDLSTLRWEDGYRHKSWIPFPCAPRLPVEPICKIFFACVGMLFELFLERPYHEPIRWQVTGIFDQPPNVEKAQHATMYSFFLLSGVMDLVTLGACCRFPKKTAQVVFALGIWVEGTLFLFHTGGRTMLDARIHFILSLSICATALAATARVLFATKVFVNLVVSIGFIFQGTWLVAIGLILYGDNRLWWAVAEGTRHEHKYVMLASMMAAWHLFCIVVVILVLWGVVMTLSQCGCKMLLPSVHVPALPACLKKRLKRAAEASQAENVLNEHAKLIENGTAGLGIATTEMEASGCADQSSNNGEIPA